MMHGRTMLWIMAPLAFAVACYIPPPDRNLKEPLEERDIVGDWEMTTASLKMLAGDATRPHRITLRADNTCSFNSYDAGWFLTVSHIQANGAWKLEHDSRKHSSTPIKNVLVLELYKVSKPDVEISQGIDFFFTREDGALKLWRYWDDPDECKYIEYIRRQESMSHE